MSNLLHDATLGSLPSAAEPSVTKTAAYALRRRLPYPIWIVYRAIRTVLVASAFAGFWGGGAIMAWTLLPIVALVSSEKTRTCQRIVAAAFRVFHGYMKMLRLVDVGPVGPFPLTESAKGRRGTVLVANHTTLVDVTAILSQVPNVCCVAKPVFIKSPFVGRLLQLAGFLDPGRDVETHAAMIEMAKKRLDDGYHVLVFPEGTRSPEGGLLPFHRGAFEIACQANVPVQAIVLRCDPSALRKGQPIWKQPDTCANISFTVEELVHPADFGHRSRRMRDAVEQRYRARLGVTPGPLAGYNN